MPDRPNARKATIYQRGRRLIVVRADTTTDGVPHLAGEARLLDDTAEPGLLGAAIRDAILAARNGTRPPLPKYWDAMLDAFLSQVGVGSWRTFVRGCRDVAVFEADGRAWLTPTINLGARQGFEGTEGNDIVVPIDDVDGLGQGARHALRMAIPRG